MKNLSFLNPGQARWVGKSDEYVRFITEKQLMDESLWQHFVEVFRTNADIQDAGWRGEYWGKMMRGGCLIYAYSNDPALYKVLENAVCGLLDSQAPDGRISTYDIEHEFTGWDMWSRKYVLTGLQHFYDICPDEALKSRIVTAMTRHADYIAAHVGNGEEQRDITTTSSHWLGVNSCSILEPFVRLYKITGVDRYLKFAEYILSTGGCSGGDLIQMALDDEIAPYQYPEQKAYETMSFFEGALAYYEITGEQRYFDAVQRFVEAVNRTDITVIGCAGCTHELFDHSAERQTEYSETIMQETCVTVTWMRLLTRLLLLTGEARYADRIETAAWNAMYGSINTHWNEQLSINDKAYVSPLPFDSYSPLYNNQRGLGIGGFKRFSDNTFYGCCACIGAAGIAILPLTAVLKSADGLCVTQLLPGQVLTETPSGKSVRLDMATGYPKFDVYTLTVNSEEVETFTVSIRIPEWCGDNYTATCWGEHYRAENGYIRITRAWIPGDFVQFILPMSVRELRLNSRTAFLRGPIVLARDAAKEGSPVDLTEEVELSRENGSVLAALLPETSEESVRLTLKRADGSDLLLTDYASCGKDWLSDNCRMTVWINVK